MEFHDKLREEILSLHVQIKRCGIKDRNRLILIFNSKLHQAHNINKSLLRQYKEGKIGELNMICPGYSFKSLRNDKPKADNDISIEDIPF